VERVRPRAVPAYVGDRARRARPGRRARLARVPRRARCAARGPRGTTGIDCERRRCVTQKRLERLRARLEEEKLDALYVTDPYNRRYLSGFTGTSGALLITRDEAVLATDFRYWEQAEGQAPAFRLCRTVG